MAAFTLIDWTEATRTDAARMVGPSVDDDALVMREVAAGRVDRFAEIVARHQSSLFRVAVNRLGERSAAEDAVQETFLAAFRGRGSYDASRPFRPWLWTIHKNVCDAMATKQSKERRVEPRRLQIATEDGAAEQLLVRELFERLPDEQAEAVRLRFFGSLTYEEIAAVQGCPTPTAKNRVRYALQKLAVMLDESETQRVRDA